MVEDYPYKIKLRHFMEGLEVEKIDEAMELSPVKLKLLGATMATMAKDLTIETLKLRNQLMRFDQ